MRDVRFKDLPAVGARSGSWTYGSLQEFVTRLSPIRRSLVVDRLLPSLAQVNRELQKGREDNGMGGGTEWKPFAISEEEYAELCEALLANPRFTLNR